LLEGSGQETISTSVSLLYLLAESNGALAILATHGVYCLVGFANRPATISCDEMDAVKRMVGASSWSPILILQCGDRVGLRAGPLEGVEGLLVRKKSVWKLVVSVGMLQRSVAVEVDATMVARGAPKWHLDFLARARGHRQS